MLKIPYTTLIERNQIIVQQKAFGFVLTEEQNLFTGNFLIFDDNLVKIGADKKYREALQTDPLIQKLSNASFTEIDTWVDNNVTNLATARELFKKMLMIMTYLLNKGE